MAEYFPKPNDTLGRYELLKAVAQGGMGQVWLARLQGARGFRKVVAIKMLRAGSEQQGRLERMLLEEARIAALIRHENVAQTLELGEHQGALYLVMEWIDGESLRVLAKRASARGGMPLHVCVNLIAQTLRGLHAAHELCDEAGAPLGVVHRDVSPQNVLVTYDGVAKLVDFGIAKATNQVSCDTEAGEIKGKFSFMAPEQVEGGEIDRRADLFAVGILLYLLTVGRHPFKGESAASVVHGITSCEPEPPSSVVPGYPPPLEAIVLKAIAKAPEARFQTAEEMRLALERALPPRSAPGVETDIKRFIQEVLGDCAERRREEVRNALQAGSQTGSSLPALDLPVRGESGSSLRAISIDRHGDEPRDVEPRRDSITQTMPPPSRVWRRKQLVLGVLLGVAVSATLLHGLSRARMQSASKMPPNHVSLSLPEERAETRPLDAEADAATSSAAEPLEPPPLASAVVSASPAPEKSASPVPSANKNRRRKRVAGSDLIPPEYAR